MSNLDEMGRAKLYQLVAATSGFKLSEFRADSRLDDDLAMDSLSKLELLQDIETEFMIHVPDEEPVEHLVTVRDVEDMILRLRGEPQ